METRRSLRIALPDELADFLAKAVADGEYEDESEAVCAALRLLAATRSRALPAEKPAGSASEKRNAFTFGRMFGY